MSGKVQNNNQLKNTNWKEGMTQAGKQKFYCKRNDKWVNMGVSVIDKNHFVWVVYDGQLIKKHNIQFNGNFQQLKDDVDKFIEGLKK